MMCSRTIEFRNWIKKSITEQTNVEFVYRIRRILREYGYAGLDFMQMIHLAQYQSYSTPMFKSDLLREVNMLDSDEDVFSICIANGLTFSEIAIIGIRDTRPVFKISYYGIKKIAAREPRIQFLLDSYYACAPIN